MINITVKSPDGGIKLKEVVLWVTQFVNSTKHSSYKQHFPDLYFVIILSVLYDRMTPF